jgi:hypothetical protein
MMTAERGLPWRRFGVIKTSQRRLQAVAVTASAIGRGPWLWYEEPPSRETTGNPTAHGPNGASAQGRQPRRV